MKKLLLSLALILALAMPAAAEHARFLGIEIDGSQEQFKQQLLRVGGIRCIESRCDDDGYVYSGSYAGYDNCAFYVLEGAGKVFAVVVYLPEASSWRQIKRQFTQMCNEYASNSNFNRTSYSTSFESPYAEGDGDEMLAVANQKCNYKAAYSSTLSTVIISISKYKQVKILISDKDNFARYQAQEQEQEAMYFMGLPITGTANEFANRLIREKGFTFKERDSDGSVLVTGTFAGYENCTIGVMPRDGNLTIGVLLPKQTSWRALRSQYFTFKSQLGNKYSLTKNVESFEDPYYDGCGNEMEGVRNDKCNFVTTFSADNGTVAVTISETSRICVLYIPD